jgi:predicted permease
MRTALVGIQVALCVVLVGGSLAFGRAVQHALSLDLGFNTTNTLIATINPSVARLGRARAQAFGRQALDRLRQDARIRDAGWAALRPMSGNIVVPPVIDGYTPARGEDVTVQENFVTDGYFDALSIPITNGRGILATDQKNTQAVAVVSASMATKYWPAGQAIGSRLSLETRGAEDPKWITIVGIAGDIHRAIGEPAPLILYQPESQVPGPFGETDYLFIRTIASPADIADDVRAILHDIDPVMPVTTIVPMATHVGATMMAHRLGLTLFVLFAALSTLLTGFGLYAVVAAAVAQRSREIGVRVALGADRRIVMRLVLSQGAVPVLGGLVTGLGLFVVSARFIRQFMFSLPVVSALTLIVITLAIGLVAALALAVPTRRALSVDPTVALRTE